MAVFAKSLIGLLIFFCASLATATEVYRVGVLTYRGEAAAIKEWQGHIDYLNERLAPRRFELAPLSYADLSAAARYNRIHFVITNSGHYTEMAIEGTANRLATRILKGPDGPLKHFGGVAIARAGRDDLKTYADLRGQRLLIPDRSSLGGWQMHLGEALDQGVDLRTDVVGVSETANHEKVVAGILAGQADVGFIRTDLLEHLAKKGRIDLAKLRIINSRRESGFPYRLSTRLYPEWPFAQVTGTPEDIGRRVLIALLDMPAGHPAAQQAELFGWTVPSSYQEIHDLFRKARLGPYEHVPISLSDLYARYGTLIVLSAAGLIGVVGLALTLALRANRSLRRSQAELASREEDFRTLANNVPGALYRCALDRDWTVKYISENIFDISGYPAADFIEHRRHYASIIHPDDVETVDREVNAKVGDRQPFVLQYRIVRADGRTGWVLEHGCGHYGADGKVEWLDGIFFDITAAKEAEAKLHQASMVLSQTAEGILITDERTRIVTVNPAFCAISGYPEAELIGQTPALLASGRHDPGFFAEMWRSLERTGSWHGEIWNRRRDGEVYPSLQTINVLRDDHGHVTGYLSLFSDISQMKESEQRLQWLAYHDPLTGLANRKLFEERLDHAIEQAARHGEKLAVLYFDLDGFKAINDRFGHNVGDRLLEAVSQRVGARLRKSDTLSRRGGDEFTILIENIVDVGQAASVAGDVLSQMRKPFVLADGKEVGCGCSIGISLYPDDSADGHELVRCADAAMYRAKQDGGGHYRLFSIPSA